MLLRCKTWRVISWMFAKFMASGLLRLNFQILKGLNVGELISKSECPHSLQLLWDCLRGTWRRRTLISLELPGSLQLFTTCGSYDVMSRNIKPQTYSNQLAKWSINRALQREAIQLIFMPSDGHEKFMCGSVSNLCLCINHRRLVLCQALHARS